MKKIMLYVQNKNWWIHFYRVFDNKKYKLHISRDNNTDAVTYIMWNIAKKLWYKDFMSQFVDIMKYASENDLPLFSLYTDDINEKNI